MNNIIDEAKEELEEITCKAKADLNLACSAAQISLEQLKPLLPNYKEGDWVEGSNNGGITWLLVKYVPNIEGAKYPGTEIAFKQIRRPINQTNILIVHDGDEMPEWVRMRLTTIFFDDEELGRHKYPEGQLWSEVKSFIVHNLIIGDDG